MPTDKALALSNARATVIQRHVQKIAEATPDAPVDPPKSPLTSPAYWLALIPVLDLIATTFFHKDLGLGDNAQQWAVIAAAIVGFGAFISRAVKHNANGKVRQAWLDYLATIVEQTGGVPVADEDDTTDPPNDGADPPAASRGESVMPRTGSVSTTRSAVAKKTTSRRGR